MVFIDIIDIERPRDRFYEGGDINETIPPPPANDMMVGGDLGNGVIDNIDKEWPRNSSYEGGDINDTIPPPH